MNQKIADHRHGTRGTYIYYHCRCEDCTRANREEQRHQDASRRARLALMTDKLPHGTASTYRNWGCRCRPCTTAQTTSCAPFVKAYYARKRIARDQRTDGSLSNE